MLHKGVLPSVPCTYCREAQILSRKIFMATMFWVSLCWENISTMRSYWSKNRQMSVYQFTKSFLKESPRCGKMKPKKRSACWNFSNSVSKMWTCLSRWTLKMRMILMLRQVEIFSTRSNCQKIYSSEVKILIPLILKKSLRSQKKTSMKWTFLISRMHLEWLFLQKKLLQD
jgi:hypothetical protein